MSRVSSRLRDSFYGLLRREALQAPPELIESIRSAMLLALGDAGSDQHLKLERTILFARDIDTLWHARPALMNAVATLRGETHAARCMVEITKLFEAYAPGTGKRR
ncbi:MAG: hypothetical protein ABIN37_18215 [Burkholderiaceae bacterium]